MSGYRMTYAQPVLLPPGYSLQEPVIVRDCTGCRFVWRDNRWLHLARCLCWKQDPMTAVVVSLCVPGGANRRWVRRG